MRSVVSTVAGSVLPVLSLTTAPLTLADVHGQIRDVSKAGVRLAILRLVEQGIVYQVPGGYVLNRQHVCAEAIIQLAQAKTHLFSRIRDEVESWDARVDLLAIFGSAARGDGGVHSDVDVLLFAEMVDIEASGQLAEKIATWSGNEGHIHVFDRERWNRLVTLGEPIVDSVRRDLVVLSGDAGLIS